MTRANHTIGAPAPVGKVWLCSPCLLPSNTLLEILNQAQADRATNGKGDAYAALLDAFHQTIFPPLLRATHGNVSELARLLGIHRGTLTNYLSSTSVNTGGAA